MAFSFDWYLAAMNTPFQWMKQVASHYGGTRNPLVISWPQKIGPEYYGQIRNQWHHVTDIGKILVHGFGGRTGLRCTIAMGG